MKWTEQQIKWFDQALEANYYPHNIIDFIEPELPEEGSFLDIGCGIGTFSLPLAERGWKVTALDVSSMALSHLEDKAQNQGLEKRLKPRIADWHQMSPYNQSPWNCIITSYSGREVVGEEDSLHQMNHLASDLIILFVPGERKKHSFSSDELFKRLGRDLRQHRCCYRDVESVLSQLNIDYNSRHFEYNFGQPFKNFEQAVRFFSRHYRINRENELEILQDFLEEKLKTWQDKLWIDNYKKSTLFWWEP